MQPSRIARPAYSNLRHAFRPEPWVVGTLLLATGIGLARGGLQVDRMDLALYSQLGSAFVAGFVIMMSVALVGRLLTFIAAPSRGRWWALGLALAIFLALVAYGPLLPPMAAGAIRLLQAVAFGCAPAATVVTIALRLTGQIEAGAWRRVFLEFIGLWWPLVIYLAIGGIGLALIRHATPRVWDPVLLRMDLSLGFRPSEALFAWEIDRHWVDLLSNGAYPVLSSMIAGVAARLYLAGALKQARRCLLALLLVGTLGFACYRLVPAIGPLPAFPGLFERPDIPGQAAAADTLRQEIVHGPDQVAGGAFARNVFPSLHTAFTLVTLAAAWSWRRRFFWFCLPLGVFQIATAMTLCVHYLVDLFAAVPFATLCWWLADRGVRVSTANDPALPSLLGTPIEQRRNLIWFVASLLVSTAGFLWWAGHAPIHPALAWLLVFLGVAGPAWAGWRLNRQGPSIHEPAANVFLASAAPLDSGAWRMKILPAAVFCSGGVALVLEQVYEKYLGTVVGSSRPAATIVLCVFFAGLALGAWLCPKSAIGAPRRLAALELFIAGWAIVVSLGFFATDRLLGGWLAGASGSVFSLAATRALIAGIWILPPTLAMGAQLPTLAAVLGSHSQWRNQSISHYYALNLAGAFAFTLATPPLLFATVGANGALHVIAAVGALTSLALWLGLPDSDASNPSAGDTVAPAGLEARLPPGSPTLLALLAGVVFFALEVVWFHLISAVCGASTYSFSLLLAVVLLGLALGGRVIHHQSKKTPLRPATILGWSSVALVVSNALWPLTGRLLAGAQSILRLEAFWAGEALKSCVVALIVLPPAIGLGMVFPLALRQAEAATPVVERSRTVGRLCLVNVIGCVVGAMLAGWVAIPLLGAERALLGLALIAAAAFFGTSYSPFPRLTALLPGFAAVALALALPRWDLLELTRGYGVYLRDPLPVDAKLTFHQEDFHSGFVTVVEASGPMGPTKTLLQNGKFDADDGPEMTAQLGFGLVAALHAPARHRALIIGCGSGQTAGLISRLGFDRVDIAELSPAHLAAAAREFHAINAGVLSQPNVRVHVEDGRNYLRRATDAYDIIQVEISSIWFAGASNLYSREFYSLARSRLSPGGTLVQWFQLHHLTPQELGSVLATARSVFPYVSVWRTGVQTCLLASVEPAHDNAYLWHAWLGSPELQRERAITGVTSLDALQAWQIVPAETLSHLRTPRPVVINTDRNRWLEFQTPRYYLSRRDHVTENLRWLQSASKSNADR